MTDGERPASGWPGDATGPAPDEPPDAGGAAIPGGAEPPAEGIWAEPEVEAAAEPVAEADAVDVPEPVFEAAEDEEPADEEPAPDLASEPATPEDDEPIPGGDDRTLALRLARLHLRMGSLALARAELEAHAGGGRLDEPALLDLAEARWRTGDLAGAGEAAHAAIERGIDDPLAYLIAAESIAAVGRPAEARRLAARALGRLDTTLDVVFAGMPRSLIWPGDPEPDEAALLAGPAGEDRSPASAAAAEAFAGGRGALAAGDVPAAALRLSLAIRLEPRFAQGVLTAIGERAATVPLLALVAGDALRVLGREQDALEAWDRARGRPAPSPGPEPPSGWDEDDPGA